MTMRKLMRKLKQIFSFCKPVDGERTGFGDGTDHNKAAGTHAGVRPGGRSARVQVAIHRAVREQEQGSSALTVPAIATLAGVTPSTIIPPLGRSPAAVVRCRGGKFAP